MEEDAPYRSPITGVAVHWLVKIDATWENQFNTPISIPKLFKLKIGMALQWTT
jgi:hypothetical protein